MIWKRNPPADQIAGKSYRPIFANCIFVEVFKRGSELVGEKWRHELIEVSADDGSERIIPTPVWNYIDDVAWEADQRSQPSAEILQIVLW